MSNPRVKLIASLYVYGDALDLDAISACLGLQPTKSRRKGEKRTSSSGREIVQKIGMWEYTVTGTSQVLSDHILELVSKISTAGAALKKIQSVQEAHIDILISALFDSDGMARCDFELRREDIDALKQIGLPVRFSVTFSQD